MFRRNISRLRQNRVSGSERFGIGFLGGRCLAAGAKFPKGNGLKQGLSALSQAALFRSFFYSNPSNGSTSTWVPGGKSPASAGMRIKQLAAAKEPMRFEL